MESVCDHDYFAKNILSLSKLTNHMQFCMILSNVTYTHTMKTKKVGFILFPWYRKLAGSWQNLDDPQTGS